MVGHGTVLILVVFQWCTGSICQIFLRRDVDKWTGEAVVQEKGWVDYNIGNKPKITN